MTINFIAHYMKHAIDLFILPPHTSHLLQPLNVDIFAPFKYTLAEEINTVSKYNSKYISQID